MSKAKEGTSKKKSSVHLTKSTSSTEALQGTSKALQEHQLLQGVRFENPMIRLSQGWKSFTLDFIIPTAPETYPTFNNIRYSEMDRTKPHAETPHISHG